MAFRPLQAGTAPADLSLLTYPVLASPKIDGIRCIIVNGQAVSRSLKPIPNDYIRRALEGIPDGMDGELLVEGGFNAVQSAVMSKDGEPKDFWFFAFDWTKKANRPQQDDPFKDRLFQLTTWSEEYGHNNLFVVEHVLIDNPDDLAAYEKQQLDLGFEGVMVRDPEGDYKCGRSTLKQHILLKVKRFKDEEATVVGFIERMHNDNKKEVNALGLTERSSDKEGKRPAGDLGVMVCESPDGAEVNLGSGFTAAERREFWERREELIGKLVKYKHLAPPEGRQPGQAPRHPVYLGFRHPEDT